MCAPGSELWEKRRRWTEVYLILALGLQGVRLAIWLVACRMTEPHAGAGWFRRRVAAAAASGLRVAGRVRPGSSRLYTASHYATTWHQGFWEMVCEAPRSGCRRYPMVACLAALPSGLL